MKRIANVVLLVGALSAGLVLGQTTRNFDRWWTPDNDALGAAPENHKLLFENDQVRVLEVTVQPGVCEPLHAHRYPSVMYYVSAAHMKEFSPGLPAVDHPRKQDGAVVFLPVGPPHQMENMETTKPLKAIRVELKNAG
jgi:predicted metal-dependent enzyme (double-stranded beta helix superfamily)